MMNNLRAASETWTGRIISTLIMAFIVLSFSIFGIGDFFRGFGTTQLASVGSAEISADSFRTAWATQLRRLSERTKGNVTNDQARAAGLDRQLLGQLVNDAVIDQTSKKMGLAISDDAITQLVTTDANLKGPGGQFDRNRFLELLRQNNLTERGYLDEQRKALLRQQQVEAVSGAMNPPVLMLEMLNRSRNERRSLDYFLLPAAAAGEIPAQSPEELQKYFATKAQNFRTPEYRGIVMLQIRPETLAKPDEVSDEAAMKRYDEVKAARYSQPEKRGVQQMPFDTEAAAAEASAKLKGGLTFEALAKERSLEDKDLDLGIVEKKALLGDIGPVAFGLAEGAVSEPVKNVFGYTLVRVTKIVPAATVPFAEVAANLKREISLINARRDAQILHDKIEENRTSGKPLAEAAKAVGLEVRTIAAMDAAGRDKAGLPVPDLGDGAALLKAVFASGKGFDNDTITTKDRGNIWFEVTEIEAARASTLEEVKPQVEQAWRSEETARRLAAKASDLVKKINDGAPLADIAEAEGKLEVKHAGSAQRSGSPDLPNAVVVQVFNVGIGAAGSANAPGGRIVFKVLDKAVQPLDGTSDDAKKLETELRAELSDEIFTQYVAQIKGETGVKLNEALLRQLTGGEAN